VAAFTHTNTYHMSLSNKQQKELAFLIKYKNIQGVTDDEIQAYFDYTVKGKGDIDKNNRLFLAKWSLDVMVKMWREDITNGLFGVQELKDDFNDEYFNELMDSIVKSVTPEYRRKVLSKGEGSVLSFTNFPKVLQVWRDML